MELPVNQIICGDCLEVMRDWPDESVDCCVTSPPYWNLRDYGIAGQLGLEKTPEEYVAKMVEIFAEVRRVLKNEGTLWINLGDSYAGSRGTGGNPGDKQYTHPGSRSVRTRPDVPVSLKPKDLCGIPWRVALALQADGWYLRQDIIWSKPNPMPESVRDRCTKAHEYIFLLTKKPRYYYDADAIREPKKDPEGDIRRIEQAAKYKTNTGKNVARVDGWKLNLKHATQGRNKRSVFSCPTQFSKMRDDLSTGKKKILVAELLKRGII